jgi:predicted nucleotidyltransferase
VSEALAYLQSHEQTAVQECVARLRQALGAKLMSVWLFGSKARGDYGPDSDIDLLVVISEIDWSCWDQIRLIAARLSLEYDALLNTHILDQARWAAQRRYQDTLWREMQRGSVALWSRAPHGQPRLETPAA